MHPWVAVGTVGSTQKILLLDMGALSRAGMPSQLVTFID